jgi:hypothetical protein
MKSLLMGLILLVSQANPTQTVRGSIQGIVKPPDSGEGISQVTVVLNEVPPGVGASLLQRTAMTDAAGRFSFADLPFSRYNVRVYKDGYFGAPADAPILSQIEVRTIATINANAPTAELTLGLMQGGTVSGVVRDKQGNPAAGVPLTLLRRVYQDGRRVMIPGATGFMPVAGLAPATNDRGEYRLFWFPPGDYYVRTEAAPLTFYPGTTTLENAVAVTVRSGQIVTGVDFEVESAPKFSISGKVKVSVPGPQGRRSVVSFYVVPRGASPVERFAIRTNAINSVDFARVEFDFLLRGIIPGAYDVYPIFADQDPFGAPLSGYKSTRIPVEVVDKDVTGLVGEIVPHADLSIRVAPTGSAPLPPVVQGLPHIQLRPYEALGSLLHPAMPQVDGELHAVASNVFPAKYKVLLPLLPPEYYLADIRQGQSSLYNDALITVTGERQQSVEVTLSTGGGAIRGIVRDNRGQPVSGRVALVPQGPRRSNPNLYRRTTAQAGTGQFGLTNIAPGEYKVFAWEKLPTGADESPEFMEKYETRGRLIAIRPGSTLDDLQLVLNP